MLFSIISHGAANVLTERLFEQSDPFVATVCKKCGMLANSAADNTILRNKVPFCTVCKDSDTSEVRMPYAFKLLVQELMALNILPRLSVETDVPDEQEISPLLQGDPLNLCPSS